MDHLRCLPAPPIVDCAALYPRYLERLLAGDRVGCAEIIQALLAANVSIRDLYVDLIHRSMYEVGERWERNEISVAKEHVATAITESMFPLIYPRILGAESTGRRAVVACVINEFHQVGARMVADMLELHGWDTTFVSVTSAEALLAVIRQKDPALLGLSLSLSANLPDLLRVIEAVEVLRPELDIIVGGQAFRSGGAGVLGRFPRVRYVSGLDDLERVLAERGSR